MLGQGEGRGGDAGAEWDGRRRGPGVGLTGIGGVGALRAGPWIGARGAGSSWVTSSGPEVGAKGCGDARLVVEAEEFLVLSSRRSSSTLRLATRVLGKLNLPVNCRFVSTPDRRMDLPCEVKPSKAWGLGGEDGLPPLGCRQPCHSPRATLSSPAMVFAASGGFGTCEFLRLQSSQHRPHMCQFLQRTWPRRVGRTAPARIAQVCSPSRRDRCHAERAESCWRRDT